MQVFHKKSKFATNTLDVLIVGDILVSDAIVETQFVCNLQACKGACCWEGDYGAPLEVSELETLERIYPTVKPFLDPKGIAVIERNGLYEYLEKEKTHATTLLDNGACVFLTYDDKGIAKCGIEKAWEAGATDFKKPISCHLYPVRVNKADSLSFEALNYDQWDICSAACALGKELQVPIYQFVKDALVRKYGSEFYEELDTAAKDYYHK